MTAARKLEPDLAADDPVLAALRAAPLAADRETDEEREADLAAIEDYLAGRGRRYSAAEIHADVEAMRHDADAAE